MNNQKEEVSLVNLAKRVMLLEERVFELEGLVDYLSANRE